MGTSSSDTEEWDTESTYSLLLDPADWEEEDPWSAIDGGDVDEEEDDLERKCPGCHKVYQGKTEKGRMAWLASHIRLHNVMDRRKKLLTADELSAELGKVMAGVLSELKGKEEHWDQTRKIASLLLETDTSHLEDIIRKHLLPIIASSGTGFFKDDFEACTKEVHTLLSSPSFRCEAITTLEDCVGQLSGLQRFLSSFLIRVKDSLNLLRLSKIKERLPTPPRFSSEKARNELVFYIVGYILKKIKDKCWFKGNIKKQKYQKRYNVIKDYFFEDGAHAEAIQEKEVRQWVDKKNRGEPGKGNGLVVPSKGAYLFFIRLDEIARSFEGVQDFTRALSMEAFYYKCMDDIELLDRWHNLTTELEELEQHLFLQSTVNHYRRFVGHATSKRIERCLPSKATVATRTNLKKNYSVKNKKKTA